MTRFGRVGIPNSSPGGSREVLICVSESGFHVFFNSVTKFQSLFIFLTDSGTYWYLSVSLIIVDARYYYFPFYVLLSIYIFFQPYPIFLLFLLNILVHFRFFAYSLFIYIYIGILVQFSRSYSSIY